MKDLVQKSLTLDSREVAKMVDKRHDHLMRDITKYCGYLIDPNFGVNEFFLESSYKDSIGRTLLCYQITEKGCALIAHKITGKKGTQFSAQYINKFEEMKKELNKPQLVPVDEYEPKYYNGKPVITLRDLESLTGVSSFAIRYQVKQRLQYFCDYYLLEGEELANFKSQNKSANKLVSCLIVITQQGFIKLVKIIKGIPMLDCFKTALPEPKKESEEIKYCVNLPQNEEAQFMISDIGRKANTVLELLYQMSFQNTKEYHEALCTAVDTLTMRMSVHSSFRLIEYDYGYVD